MLGQSDLVDEAMSGRNDRSRLEAGVGPEQQRDESGNDCRVAGREEVEHPVALLCMKPDLGLAPLHLVIVGKVLLRVLGQLAAKVDDVLVPVHPVVEELELVDDLAMNLLDGLGVQDGRPTLEF